METDPEPSRRRMPMGQFLSWEEVAALFQSLLDEAVDLQKEPGAPGKAPSEVTPAADSRPKAARPAAVFPGPGSVRGKEPLTS
jgi:hypothetical protein